MEKISLEELLEKLDTILNRWHIGTRPGNDGNQGNTLEDLLGVSENNLSIPDYGQYELKTQKIETGSLITLFHKEPMPARSVPKLLKSVGWPHQEAGRSRPKNEMSFRMTTPSNCYTARGFKVDLDSQKIWFNFETQQVNKLTRDKTSNYPTLGDWLNDVENNREIHYSELFPLYYDRAEIEKKCIEKLDNTLFVTCKTRKRNGKKEFFFNEAFLLNGFDSSKFEKLFQEGVLYIDFDARTGHNHGTKFRVKKDKLVELFRYSRRIS